MTVPKGWNVSSRSESDFLKHVSKIKFKSSIIREGYLYKYVKNINTEYFRLNNYFNY